MFLFSLTLRGQPTGKTDCYQGLRRPASPERHAGQVTLISLRKDTRVEVLDAYAVNRAHRLKHRHHTWQNNREKVDFLKCRNTVKFFSFIMYLLSVMLDFHDFPFQHPHLHCAHVRAHTHTHPWMFLLQFFLKSNLERIVCSKGILCMCLFSEFGALQAQVLLLKMATAQMRRDTPVNVISKQSSSIYKAQSEEMVPRRTTWGQINVRWLTVFITTSAACWARCALCQCGGGSHTILPRFPLFSKTHHLQEQSPRSHHLSWRNSW